MDYRRIALLLLASCHTDDAGIDVCAPIGTTCMAAASSPVSTLLIHNTLASCLALGSGKDQPACSAMEVECDAECSLPVKPENEQTIVGCWTDTDQNQRICLGQAFVPDATNEHAYNWFDSVDPTAAAAFSQLYETFEDYGVPGRLAFYGFRAGTDVGCANILFRSNAIFTSQVLDTTDDCKGVSDDTLGPYTSRWDHSQ